MNEQEQAHNRRYLDALARFRGEDDHSRDAITAYVDALANVTFLHAVRVADGDVQVYLTQYGEDPAPLIPVFTSAEEYEAFRGVIPEGYQPVHMHAVPMCQMVVEAFPPTTTLAVNPAAAVFARVPPDLIRIVAAAEWHPSPEEPHE